jgi:uncharacterized SAM-binding protein YcdF (DUF218 family)
LKDCKTLVNTSNAAHKPSDNEAHYHGETRSADGYQYWTTSEEDEESLDIGAQADPGESEARAAKTVRRKILDKGVFRRTGIRIASLILITVLAGIGYFVFNYVQVSGAQGDDNTRQSDAAIVLGAAQYNGLPSYVLQERLDHAFNLYNDDVVNRIFVTGGGAEGEDDTEGNAGFQHLRGRGVPEDDITLIPEGTNSWQQLSASAAQIQVLRLDSVLLVSDGYHNYRLLDIADELGLVAYVSPSAVDSTVMNTLRESAAVSIGRITGYRRLSEFTED